MKRKDISHKQKQNDTWQIEQQNRTRTRLNGQNKQYETGVQAPKQEQIKG